VSPLRESVSPLRESVSPLREEASKRSKAPAEGATPLAVKADDATPAGRVQQQAVPAVQTAGSSSAWAMQLSDLPPVVSEKLKQATRDRRGDLARSDEQLRRLSPRRADAARESTPTNDAGDSSTGRPAAHGYPRQGGSAPTGGTTLGGGGANGAGKDGAEQGSPDKSGAGPGGVAAKEPGRAGLKPQDQFRYVSPDAAGGTGGVETDQPSAKGSNSTGGIQSLPSTGTSAFKGPRDKANETVRQPAAPQSARAPEGEARGAHKPAAAPTADDDTNSQLRAEKNQSRVADEQPPAGASPRLGGPATEPANHSQQAPTGVAQEQLLSETAKAAPNDGSAPPRMKAVIMFRLTPTKP